MDYELIMFILGTFIITGGSLWGVKYLRTKGYSTEDITTSLDISKILIRFVTITLTRKMHDRYKVLYYADLIVDAIDYMKTIVSDIPAKEKVNRAINKMFSTSNTLGIKLSIEEKEIITEVLTLAYDMYISLEKNDKLK